MTLKEVARLAKVSPSAVSRYLNGGPLSAEKSAAIRAVIERTGYYPDQAAHTLRTGRVKQVGVIVPRIHSEAVSQVIAGATEALDRRGYLPVLGCTGRDLRQEARYLEMMRAYRVAGIILMASSGTEEAAEVYRACPLPLVITGQRIPGLSCVYHDDRNAVRALTEHLLARGRRRICCISVDERDTAVGTERLQGVRAALEGAGLDAEALPVAVASFDWASGRACMERLLAENPDLDGVVCATDTIAQGALAALRQAGRRVPEDVSLVGVGDDWADLVSIPPLTTARLGQAECGREAASLLLRLITQPSALVRQVRLGYELVDRGSV